MSHLPIFVISLARATERRTRISNHLRAIGAQFEIVEAVDGRALPASDIAAVMGAGVDFHPGVVGCYLSHTNVYRTILGRNLPAALILEDDVVLAPSVPKVTLSDLPIHSFDYFYLDCGHPQKTVIYYNNKDRIHISGLGVGYRLNSGPNLMHGYIITNASARRRLESAFPIVAPIDIHVHDNSILRFYSLLRPRNAATLNEDSLVSSTRHNQTPMLKFHRFKNSSFYFGMRNLFHPAVAARRRKIPELKRIGALSSDGDWRPLPDGTVLRSWR
jgi:GR25 family glycosyltransferase involved in LPS biosynthesis